ncbi:MAG: SDR family oxidoreductase [Gemmatimonadota bacterium]|nr:SDR family oxidoreductase [Gemmatimonadota bacterium]
MRPRLNVLVTGATGLIGRGVVRSLLRRSDAAISVLVRDVARWQRVASGIDATGARVTPVQGDITRKALGIDPRAIRRVTTARAIIVHSAADVVFSRSLAEARHTNVEGTRNVLELASSFPHARVVFVSTAFAVGRRTGHIGDDDRATDAGWVNAYEQSKHEAEELVRASEVEHVIVRPTTIVCDDVRGEVSQVNAVHRALRLYHAGLASMMPGAEDTPVDVVPAHWVSESIAALALGSVSATTVHLCAGQRALALGALLDRTYAFWARETAWRRRGIARPALSDLPTYELFERSVHLVGDARLQRITRSLSHFIPQLALPKRFDTRRAASILHDEAPPVSAYWERMLAWLLATNWSAALPEAA